MTPETQHQLIDLAHRGAKCESWSEWCNMRLFDHPLAIEPEEFDTAHSELIGPLPSTDFLNDQLGEFLERAGVWSCEGHFYFDVPGQDPGLIESSRRLVGAGCESLIDRLKAAITLIERAHRLGEHAGMNEQQAAPYMAAFNKGLGKCLV